MKPNIEYRIQNADRADCIGGCRNSEGGRPTFQLYLKQLAPQFVTPFPSKPVGEGDHVGLPRPMNHRRYKKEKAILLEPLRAFEIANSLC